MIIHSTFQIVRSLEVYNYIVISSACPKCMFVYMYIVYTAKVCVHNNTSHVVIWSTVRRLRSFLHCSDTIHHSADLFLHHLSLSNLTPILPSIFLHSLSLHSLPPSHLCYCPSLPQPRPLALSLSPSIHPQCESVRFGSCFIQRPLPPGSPAANGPHYQDADSELPAL